MTKNDVFRLYIAKHRHHPRGVWKRDYGNIEQEVIDLDATFKREADWKIKN